ncbi:MAG: hypothetical protein MJ135_07620 [Oscillospiraceae bacterium]|nr:hypothetical protein [Oscillospiraceae bacterium]
MLDENAIGLKISEPFHYTWRDTALYNISVGAQTNELEYVYEKKLKVIPTFGVVPVAGTFGYVPYHEMPYSPVNLIEGIKSKATVHMTHVLTIHKPIAPEGELTIEKEIVDVCDRGEGRGAVIVMNVTGRDAAGEAVFTNTIGFLKPQDGGFGGHPVPKTDIVMPAEEAPVKVRASFPENAAVLYRLTGDTLPLHVDPEFAQKSGFPRPLLHGLCSLGFAARILVNELVPGEPERIRSIENQFRSPAFPGDEFEMQIWKNGEHEALFRMVNNDGKSIIDYGRVRFD